MNDIVAVTGVLTVVNDWIHCHRLYHSVTVLSPLRLLLRLGKGCTYVWWWLF